MADGVNTNDSEQHTNESCNDVKHNDADDARTQPPDDAELDDILEGSLHRLKITPRHVYMSVL